MKTIGVQLKPITTEKAVMLIEKDNVITFTVSPKFSKDEVKKTVEELFEVKVEKVRTSIRNNKKYTYVKLKKEFPAIDLATKIGII
ncbi:50S ribosomal protein L23 [archaeon]|jgi:large subunit ribosomal protein L23|nr:50S ribosomal protein L23 [archaeon]MBT4373172.1 50S ribosomal protein L23 [archaeon]MBT4531517.1 50S ribosomal protein L23 [archaeon]MBT7001305.1 50S ribosomal protein L23 [archaeon]MBT7282209.1 50S ribosomal protein L23 [archaeon]